MNDDQEQHDREEQGRGADGDYGGRPETDERFIHLLRAGTSLLKQGKASDALPYLREAYALNPESLDAALNLSGAFILDKKFSKAVPILERLRKEYPENAMVLTNLGAAYLGNPILATEEHQMRAIEAFQEALEVNPDAPSVAYNIGLIYRDRQEKEEAIRWFRRAVETNPGDRDARSIMKRLERDLADGDEEEHDAPPGGNGQVV
ncbi:MAG: tetratricopeptide repeat protein [Candidatus Promineifilaceae bacterium]|nr:tetratricopeptide repeat protein [Candidatus Promineifilaceae bacterium]